MEGSSHDTGRKLELLHVAFAAFPWWLRGLFVAARDILQCLEHVGESFVGLLRPIVNVADSDVEVTQPLREVAITSG